MRYLCIALCLLWTAEPSVEAAPWVAADWQDQEPNFPAGSLFWHTNKFKRCPVLYRTVLRLKAQPIAYAGLRARASWFAYVFLNGHQIADYLQKGEGAVTNPFAVELSPLLRPGANVLVLSTTADGFTLEGGIVYRDGSRTLLSSEPQRWKAQKFPPLTVLEDEPCMEPTFDDADWFPVRATERKGIRISERELEELGQRLASERLRRWDEDARWRLRMLAEKGFAIVDWEAFGWAGAERWPEWVTTMARQATAQAQHQPAGWLYRVAEALTRFVRLRDEATNLTNHVVGWEALHAPARDIEICRQAAGALRALVQRMEASLKARRFDQALTLAAKGEAVLAEVNRGRLLNELCRCRDNKFGWFDTTALLDNDIARWGLRFGSAVRVLASPLSPAALITLNGRELILQGWEELPPLRLYKKPPLTGPVCLWAVLNGQVVGLKPGADGVVYDRAVQGRLSENWVLLVSDLARGGPLPTQLIFLRHPTRIAFKMGEKGTQEVAIAFDRPGVSLFILRPFKEWRGLLRLTRTLTQIPLNGNEIQPYLRPCRLWSRAVLCYPITFSEAFVRDPQDRWALLVADVYNYLESQDEWGTEPLRLAPLPPLTTYGLLRGYPGLKVLSEAEVLGSRGIWGDHIAAVGRDHIVYRVPLDPIPRFGGFTAFCFGPTDIGEPGSLTEIRLIKRTGANSFRPQHNQTGERAMRTLRWCVEEGLQHVFNTDEKWVPDIVEHFRTLAERCKNLPFEAVAYDLLNEPETREPEAYNVLIRKITRAIRAVDRTHLIYVETIPPWGPGARPFPQGAFANLEPTGDSLTVYSFHDYAFRLPPRWPNEEHDVRDLLRRWIPAFKFSIDHRAPIHLGEFGGFEQTKEDVYTNRCTLTLLMDYFRLFDQFGWHFHYYSDRGTVRVREDGSLQESLVQKAFRRYFARGTLNAHRRL